MLLGHLVTYFAHLLPTLWGEVLSHNAIWGGPSSSPSLLSSHVPLCKHDLMLSSFYRWRNRFGEAKLIKVTKQISEWRSPSDSEAMFMVLFKPVIYGWGHSGADFVPATMTPWPGIPGELWGCRGHRELIPRVSPQAQRQAHQGTT